MMNPANIEPMSSLLIDFKLRSIGKCDQARQRNAHGNAVLFISIDQSFTGNMLVYRLLCHKLSL